MLLNLRWLVACVMIALPVAGDDVVLKNGNTIRGEILGTSSDEVFVKVDQIRVGIRKEHIKEIIERPLTIRAVPAKPDEPPTPAAKLQPKPEPEPEPEPQPQPRPRPEPKKSEPLDKEVQEALSRYRTDSRLGVLLKEEEYAVRLAKAARNDIGRIVRVIERFRDVEPQTARLALLSLACIDAEEAFTAVRKYGKDKLVTLRLAAAVALARTARKDAAPALAEMLGDPNSDVARTALDGLRDLHSRGMDLKDTLARASESSEPSIRMRAAVCMGYIGKPWASSRLVELLGDSDESVLVAAVQGLARCGGAGAALEVAWMLYDDHANVRREAALALGKMGFKGVVGDLIEKLRDEEEGVRQNALWSLQQLTGEKLDADYERWHSWWEATKK